MEDVEFLFEQNSTEYNSLTLEYLKIGEKKIPVDGRFSVYIPYRGGMYSFPYVSIIDVLKGKTPLETLKDKILLLGTSATGMMDLRSTPVGDTYIGVEIHASVISGILDERFKLIPSYINAIEATFLLLLTVFLHIAYSRIGAVSGMVIFPVALVTVLGFGFVLWHQFDFVLPLANSILLVITLSLIHTAYDFFVESRQKRRMNQFFEQYIPSELVKEMDSNSQELSLSGESKEMSVLFSDVRGFTTISEKMTPEDLTQLMNEFLTPITKVIHDNRGTIDKYMGDCVMAFWGAPLDDTQHANNSVRSSFELISAMNKIQPAFDKKGWPTIKVGVGVSSGEMHVGNMGSEFRMAYTVMGNTVNIGARLEGLTKSYGVDIIVSDVTANQATDYEYRELDRVLVKGKKKPISIYEPLCKKGELTEEQQSELNKYQQALNEYHLQNWTKAELIFKQLKSEANKIIYDIYLGRIIDYQQKSPGENWDGVFEHTTK
ncbi:MAG: adenylate/guanylate cyclase domain-containing protein [Gammaproteobacteria bacterium]|nr:adenylate/guanylate cyclase domain-containing protein [Gammaproteobacteria bacterium]